jgi:hypothetical protein
MAIVYRFYPDCCPATNPCRFEVDANPERLVAVERLCPHHASLGLSDVAAHLAVINSTKARESARWAIKQQWMIDGQVDKEYPGVPYTIDADGTIRITTGAVGSKRAQLRTLAAAEVAKIAQVPGIAAVVVD